MPRKPTSTHLPSRRCTSSSSLNGALVCGRLARSLYGTRDAPSLWERFAAAQLKPLGFVRGSASSCVFRHASRDLVVVVHGDDFVFAGVDADLEWVHRELEAKMLFKKVGT